MTLSNGNEAVEQNTAEIIDAITSFNLGAILGKFFYSLSLASSYVASIDTFMAMALTIVGEAPFQQLVIPSSAMTLLKASNTCL